MFPRFRVQQGDVRKVPSDLLLLKYAGRFYGADRHVFEVLTAAGACSNKEIRPDPDDSVVVETKGVIAPSRVMFLGTPDLSEFAYAEMRHFAARSVEILARRNLPVRRLTTVIHGVGYGLDAAESLGSLIQGFREAVAEEPSVALEEVVFVEKNRRRARGLSAALGEEGPEADQPPAQRPSGTPRGTLLEEPAPTAAEPPPGLAAPPTTPKRHVFVAMPYAEEFEDVYEFGIYAPVRRCGFICERVDRSAFTGDILERIRQRIETADLVIADLSGGRPNVYLEVGYAWGKGTEVVFVAREGEELHFDVRAHRCIYYKRIGQLARDLEKLIRGLRGLGSAHE